MTVARPTLSSMWHRVADLAPSLRPQVQIIRHLIRGTAWYVAYDQATNRSFRFSKEVYRILIRLDGKRTIDEIWTEIAERDDEDAPVQDDLVRVLGQMYLFDMLQADAIADPEELAERSGKVERKKLLKRFQNPLYLQVPLLDPDRLLNKTIWVAHLLFSPLALILWVFAIGWFALQAGINWDALTSDIAGRVLSADNLVLMLVIFPVLKIIHELGHAYAVKKFGGEVHEIGLMFLIFLPVPYVDASASSVFASKWQRAIVAAAGMYAELFVAAGAMLVWLNAEPGLLRALAFSTMFIASISTLLFNGNPLLRFDAYYILSDLFELPNLATRANRYWQYLIKHHIFGVPNATNPVSEKGESLWFLLFAPASLAYRMFILIGISIFVATTYLFVGIVLVIWSISLSIIWPLLKGLFYIFFSGHLVGRRVRAVLSLAVFLGMLGYALFGVPIPYATVAQGVVIAPEAAFVKATSNGAITKLLVRDGVRVERGTPLFTLENRDIYVKQDIVSARMDEVRLRLLAAEVQQPHDVPIARQHLALLTKEKAQIAKKVEDLTIRAPQAGTLRIWQQEDLERKFIRRGQLIAHVLTGAPKKIKVVVPQDQADLVRNATHLATIHLASRLDQAPVLANQIREFPGATRVLPSPALAQAFGGPLALDPSAKDHSTALFPFFIFELTMPDDGPDALIGELAHIRFDHGQLPLGYQLTRVIRQAFLRHFGV
ncbi:MAG: peptidase M50 [Cohaesibacter sp.]|nr:peptidase M50 [Cohaesibacter sp.]